MTPNTSAKNQAAKALKLARMLVWCRKGGGNRINVKSEDKIERRLRAACEKIEAIVGYDPWDQIMSRAKELGGTMPMPGKDF